MRPSHWLSRALAALMLLLPAALQAQEVDSRGLHIQPWIVESSMNLSTDLERAAAQGKDLLVLVEQRGCIYCAELHAVNFTRTEIVDLITTGFMVIQIDLVGGRMIRDFDGDLLTETGLVDKWGVQFTPTTMVFAAENAKATSVAEAETFRLPGYLEPFYYFTALDYFASGSSEDQGFKAFLQARLDELDAKGLTPDTW